MTHTQDLRSWLTLCAPSASTVLPEIWLSCSVANCYVHCVVGFTAHTWDLKSWLILRAHSASTVLSEIWPSNLVLMLLWRYSGGTSPPWWSRAETASSVRPSVTWHVLISILTSITCMMKLVIITHHYVKITHKTNRPVEKATEWWTVLKLHLL